MGGGWTHCPAGFSTTCPGKSAGAAGGGGFGGVSCARTAALPANEATRTTTQKRQTGATV